MTIWFHSTIIATGLAAAVAVGIAGAAVYNRFDVPVAAKADRLSVTVPNGSKNYITLETRGSGVSVLTRVPVTLQATN